MDNNDIRHTIYDMQEKGTGDRNNGTRNPCPGTRTKGAILVTALCLVSLLSIFGVGLSRLAWSSYNFSRWQGNAFYSRKIADSVLLLCKNNRQNDKSSAYDTLFELPLNEVFECGEFEGRYSLIDEERFININSASSSIIEDLPSFSRSNAKEIIEYRNKPIYPLEEILLVDDIEEENYEEIKDLVTVYGNGRVNINTCSEETLERLGMTDNLIEGIIDFRKGFDGELYTEDDRAFTAVTKILISLKDSYRLSGREQQTLLVLINKGILCVKSSNYRVVLDIYKNERLVSNYLMVIGQNEKENKFIVKEWKAM